MSCGAIALLLFTGGCVTLSQKAQTVQVHTQVSNLLDGCKKLGPVVGQGKSMVSPDQAITEAKVNLRENVADKGGDTVAILNIDNITNITTWEAHVQGIAFKCH